MGYLISVIIPVYNASRYLATCLEHLYQSSFRDFECIVVDDCSTDGSAEVARKLGVTVLTTGQRSGPAHARNLGAKVASGDFLCFIDADVSVYPSTLERIHKNFTSDPELAAAIGSYDDSPESHDFLSMYRNLMHCFVHHNSRRDACTFWTGCGAIRKSIFVDFNGFDESYDRPKIEDIELGYRLSSAGKKLILDTTILVKHLKVWSFLGLVRTDIFDRGIPWTELLLKNRRLPNDLNLQTHYRLSVALAYLLLALTAVATWSLGAPFVLALCTLMFLFLVPFGIQSNWKLHPKAVGATVALAAATGILAYRSHTFWLLPTLSSVYLLLLLRHLKTVRLRTASGLLGGIVLLALILMLPLRLSPSPFVVCLQLILLSLVLLNWRFYEFLGLRMGKLTVLSVIPFHLLFFCYSGFSFLVGAFLFCFQPMPEAEPVPLGKPQTGIVMTILEWLN